MNLTRLFELIADDEFVSVKWRGFAGFEYQGKKGNYFYNDDDIIVLSISSSKEDGIILVVDIEERVYCD